MGIIETIRMLEREKEMDKMSCVFCKNLLQQTDLPISKIASLVDVSEAFVRMVNINLLRDAKK